MITRRHQKSAERHEQLVAESVASCMAEFQKHISEARHFLVVSSVQAELAHMRNAKDRSVEDFRAAHERIESLIRGREWLPLQAFITGIKRPDVFIADSPKSTETGLTEQWRRFSGFGISVASSAAWLSEPKMYYLVLWKD